MKSKAEYVHGKLECEEHLMARIEELEKRVAALEKKAGQPEKRNS